jgi:4-hydroxybenzoate polyprenyltransferase
MSEPAAQALSTPRPWILRVAPRWAGPYLRLGRFDRPVGVWLLLWPCWWSLSLARAEPWLFALFGIGAIALRAAGCVVNDIADRRLDAAVARTRDRPLASGELGLAQALAFLALLLAVGLAVLLQLRIEAIALGAAALPLVALYPLMKRITWWPQAFLGITFNWGALLGWMAATGELGPPAILLYAAGIAWTLGYDTIYAHQDKADDEAAGIKSSARLLGGRTRPWLGAFYAAAWAGIALAGLAAGVGWILPVALLPAAAHLAWQAATVDIDRPEDCLAKFRSNIGLGWLVAGALAIGAYAA